MPITAGSSNLARAGVLVAVALLLVAASLLATDRSAMATAAPAPEAYSVLDRPASPSDQVPDRRVTVGRMSQDMPEINVAGARVISRESAGTTALIPRNDGQLCLARMGRSGYGGIACVPNDIANSEGVLMNVPGAAFGVVPDGVSKVTFRLSDGTFGSTAVEDNLYRAPREATLVAFEAGERSHEFDLTPASQIPPNVKIDG